MVISLHRSPKSSPTRTATMPNRSVCQWDKEDRENLGIVKINSLASS
jgi:DNA polymerase III alpha subunit